MENRFSHAKLKREVKKNCLVSKVVGNFFRSSFRTERRKVYHGERGGQVVPLMERDSAKDRSIKSISTSILPREI